MMTLKGEMGYKTALSAPMWGFQDVLFGGKELTLARPLDSYVIENVLLKFRIRRNSTHKRLLKPRSSFTLK